MPQAVLVRRDVLRGQRQGHGQFAADPAHHVQHRFRNAQQVALLGDGRQRHAALVDQAIAARRVDRQDGVHARIDFVRHHFAHRERRTHHRHGMVRTRAGARADVRADAHGARHDVALASHRHQLERRGNGNHRAVAVRHQARDCRAGADAAQAAHDAQLRRRVIRPGDHDGQKIRGRAVAFKAGHFHLALAGIAQHLRHGFARDVRGRQQLDGIDHLLHAGISSGPGRNTRGSAWPWNSGASCGPISETLSPRTRSAAPSGRPSTGSGGCSGQNAARRWARGSPRCPGGWALV
ncbi:hypothetical protein G6F22_013894 [Rhizopus arrhizus]|nr:hypothetical protein G6F22_013894 [Rhizopus arrhizus]